MQQAGPLRRVAAMLLARGAERLDPSTADGAGRISEAELRALIAANTGHRHVREVMVPRTEVRFIDAALGVPEAVCLVRAAGQSRFPVIDGEPDHVIGFVHLRDLVLRPEVVSSGGAPATTIRELTRPVKRLPASKRVLAALSEMRREGHHLAVVEDEYGGTAGIVTLEDLIEELVGDIYDEYDAAPEPVRPAGSGPSEVDGRLNLADFAERTGLVLPSGPYETVAGFLMARLGRVPGAGDEVRVGGCRLVVGALDGRRVARVLIVPPPVSPVPPVPPPRHATSTRAGQ